MAELNTSESHHKGKKVIRGKKMSTKIDMTPMVDLAFLLVTFFMLTTTFSKPHAMEIVMPEKPKPNEIIDTTKVRETEAMTIIMDQNNRLYYYFGIQDPKVETSNYSPNGIRKVLIQKDADVKALQRAQGRDQKGAVVLIKPMDKSRYENMVNILDEMKISGVARYAIVAVTPEELEMLPKF